ncbi:MAG: hypothetical protein U1A78_02925 [Polyangia bacterium]
MGASQRPGGSVVGLRQGQGPARRHEQGHEQAQGAAVGTGAGAGAGAGQALARSTAWEGALVAPDAAAGAAAGAARSGATGGARPARRGPGTEQATVELLIPLCQKAEYEAVKAALWQWRTRWRREITYSFKSNLRRRPGPTRPARAPSLPGPDPRELHELPDAVDAADAPEAPGSEVLPTVWVVKASARALAELPIGYVRRLIPDLVPRWGVIACVRDQYTDTGRGERQYGTKHFAVGTEVYAHPPLSPGPYERALFTGLHRQTKRFVTVMQPTLRFEDWRVGEISHPVVLHEFRSTGVWEHSGALDDARRLSHQMNERVFQLKITRPPLEPPIGPDMGPDMGPAIGLDPGPGLRAARSERLSGDGDLGGDPDEDPGDR